MSKTNFSPTFPMFPGDAEAVVPSDTINLPEASVIYSGSGGVIRVLTAQGSTVTFNSVLAGTILPVQVSRVFSTGTTAVNMVRIF